MNNTYKTVLNFFETHIDFDKGLISAPYDLNNVFESLCTQKNEYEFNNECFQSCPEGTKLDESNNEKKFVYAIIYII